MKFSLAAFLQHRRSEIIGEWVNQLKTEAGEQYAGRPRQELYGTATEAFDAEYNVLVNDDFNYINKFINKITKMRLEAGFLLSDVQKAFELFRSIVIPLLVKETTLEEFFETITMLNKCLSYTIHRFSDHFQSIHEKEILEHNRLLEEEVKIRTTELKESELKYKTLVEEINDGYFVVQNEVIAFANRAFCQMHGYRLDEVLGKKFHFFVDPRNRKKVIEIYNKSLSKKTIPRIFEYLRLTKTGESYPTEIHAKNTHYDNKISNIGICRDITKRVKMEQKVRETEQMAYIGQITTSLSHEIRNPLSAVKMNLQILKKNRKIQGNDQRRIDISVREVKRLEGILEELLDFAKPLQLKYEQHQINNLLASSLELLEMKFKEEAITVITDFKSNLPFIVADGEKLGQAFINILLNALEASGQGSTIEIRSNIDSTCGEGINVIIADEGYGVSEEQFPEIFKPFYTTKSKGTGLGLSNASRIIEAHRGKIDVENREPGGAVFKVFLPCQNSHSLKVDTKTGQKKVS